MDAIEKRARKALARFYRARGRDGMAALILKGHVKATDEELSGVIEYMTPPEGYVLVPVEATASMLDACGIGANGVNRQLWAAMLAARPEVP